MSATDTVLFGLTETQRMDEEDANAAQMYTGKDGDLPPEGCCQYGCDGSGWVLLPEHLTPGDLAILMDDGSWWPCECNVGATWRAGQRYMWPKTYPVGYLGPRVEPPEHQEYIFDDTCRCVLPEQSCSVCREAARETYGAEIPF